MQSFKSFCCLFVFWFRQFMFNFFRKLNLHHFSFLRFLFIFLTLNLTFGEGSSLLFSLFFHNSHFMEWYQDYHQAHISGSKNAFAHFVQVLCTISVNLFLVQCNLRAESIDDFNITLSFVLTC